MNTKEKYIKNIKERFDGKAKNLLIKQVKLFYDENQEIIKNKYHLGEDVMFFKGTFIHGIF